MVLLIPYILDFGQSGGLKDFPAKVEEIISYKKDAEAFILSDKI